MIKNYLYSALLCATLATGSSYGMEYLNTFNNSRIGTTAKTLALPGALFAFNLYQAKNQGSLNYATVLSCLGKTAGNPLTWLGIIGNYVKNNSQFKGNSAVMAKNILKSPNTAILSLACLYIGTNKLLQGDRLLAGLDEKLVLAGAGFGLLYNSLLTWHKNTSSNQKTNT